MERVSRSVGLHLNPCGVSVEGCVVISGNGRLERGPDESSQRCSDCRVSSERVTSRSGIKPIDNACGRAESRSGED